MTDLLRANAGRILCLLLLCGGGCRPSADKPAKGLTDAGVQADADANAGEAPVAEPPGNAGAATQDDAAPSGIQEPREPSSVTAAAALLPWEEGSGNDGLRAFEDIAFAPFSPDRRYPDRERLEQWLEPISEGKHTFRDVRIRNQRGTRVTGVFRLRAPWREEAALRVAVDNSHGWTMHFFHGNEGVSLVSYQRNHLEWAAYQTTRKDGSAVPDTWALAATDQRRNRRLSAATAGTIDIWYHDSRLVMMRGDVELLSAHLTGPPDEVVFAGACDFAGLDMIPCRDFRRTDMPEASIVWSPAAAHQWFDHLPPGTQRQSVGDTVQLTAHRATQPGWTVTPIGRERLGITVVRLDHVTPGIGLFLGGGPDTGPNEVVRFVRNRRDGRLCAESRFADNATETDRGILEQRLLSCVGQSAWLRMVSASGMLRWWISCDGQSWAELDLPRSNVKAQATHLGIYHVAGAENCQVTLSAIGTLDLPQINALVDPNLISRASPSTSAADFRQWLAACRKQQPSDISAEPWILAHAVRTLSMGCNRDIGDGIVHLLWNSSAAKQRTFLDRLALLVELGWFEDLRQGNPRIATALARYHDLALEAHDGGLVRPYTSVRRALATAPLAVRAGFPAIDEVAIRHEIVQLLYREEWDELLRLCQLLRFYEMDSRVPLTDWAGRLAAEQLGRWDSAEAPSPLADWRQPSIETISREIYSVTAELRALVESGDLIEAARVVTAMDLSRPERSGLAPQAADPRHLVSLPVAIQSLYRDSAAFAQTARGNVPLGELHLQQAIQRGDIEAIRHVAIQFAGTVPAGQARRWLGDYALSRGWFEHALAQFLEDDHLALEPADQSVARVRLAAAMRGNSFEGRVEHASFGGHDFSSSQFETLVDGLLRDAPRVTSPQIPRPPPDSALSIRPLAELPVSWTGHLPSVRGLGRDVPARIVGAVPADQTVYVAGRQQVQALGTDRGDLIWQSPNPVEEIKNDPWALIPSRPLVLAHSLITTFRVNDRAVVAAIDRVTGHLQWKWNEIEVRRAVSDPFLLDGRLLCLVMTPSAAADQWILALADIDPENGGIIGTYDLLEFDQNWWRQRDASVRTLGDRFVAAVGGVLLVADAQGNVQWLRRQWILPATIDGAWMTQDIQPPLWNGGRLYALLPGTSTVDCVDGATGTLVWRVVLPGAEQVLGIVNDCVMIRTDRQVVGLAGRDGQVGWRHPGRDWLGGFTDPGTGQVLLAQRTNNSSDHAQVELQWLDAGSGESKARAVAVLAEPYRHGWLRLVACDADQVIGVHLPDTSGQAASVISISGFDAGRGN